MLPLFITQDLTTAVESLPKLLKKKKALEMHTNILKVCNSYKSMRTDALALCVLCNYTCVLNLGVLFKLMTRRPMSPSLVNTLITLLLLLHEFNITSNLRLRWML